MRKNELSVINDALQYQKGFTDALKEIDESFKKYDDFDFEKHYKKLYENSIQLIEDYKDRYITLRKKKNIESEKNVTNTKGQSKNESRKSKRN